MSVQTASRGSRAFSEALSGKGPIRRLVRRPAGLTAAVFLVVLGVVAILAPLIAPEDPYRQVLSDALESPNSEYWLGTDGLGRDVLSRLIFAARAAFVAPMIAVGIAVILGVPSGLIAGYRQGAIDAVVSRVSDMFMAIPPIVAALAVIAVLGPGLVKAMVAVGLVYSPRLFRVVRGAAVDVSGETFITAAEAIGSSNRRIVWVHGLPNILGPLLVQVTLLMGFALLAEASLSFLGLGIQLPDASWGSMLRTAADHQFSKPYGVVPPGLALTMTVLAWNTLGDTVRDELSMSGVGR